MNAIVSVLAVAVASAAVCSGDVIHHWRFEADPGFLVDSVGNADLTPSANAQPTTLPIIGRGSAFRRLDLGNDEAADLPQMDFLSAPVTPSGDFTVEVFATADFLGTPFGDTLAGSGLSRFNINIGWIFQLRGTFVLIACSGSAAVIVDSGIPGNTGKDYYAAVALDVAGGEATFYVQNLTDRTTLQVATVPYTLGAYNAISTFCIGGVANGDLGFDGLIDEVRLSNHVLAAEELLVNQLVECPGDVDADRDVDLSDLSLLLGNFGCTAAPCVGDFDADGDTDISDLSVLLAYFGRGCF